MIQHYFIDQCIEVKGLKRKLGNGAQIVISEIGIIRSISKIREDIAYNVEFPIKMEHKARNGGKNWTTPTCEFTVLHTEDGDKIDNVFWSPEKSAEINSIRQKVKQYIDEHL